jgi:hypothetical protein
MSSFVCVCLFCPKIGFWLLVFFFPVRLVVVDTNDRIFFTFHESISRCPARKFVVVIPRPRMVVENISPTHTHKPTLREECLMLLLCLLSSPNELFTLLFAFRALIFQCPSCHSSSLISSLTSFIPSPSCTGPYLYIFFFLFCLFVR